MGQLCSTQARLIISSNLRSRSTAWPNTLTECACQASCALAKGWRTRRCPDLARPKPTRSPPTKSPHCSARVDALLAAVAGSRPIAHERRVDEDSPTLSASDWIKPRSVWLVTSREMREMGHALCTQLDFFGFQTQELPLGGQMPAGDVPSSRTLYPPFRCAYRAHARMHRRVDPCLMRR